MAPPYSQKFRRKNIKFTHKFVYMREKLRERMIMQVREMLTFGGHWVKGIHYITLATFGRSEIIPEKAQFLIF